MCVSVFLMCFIDGIIRKKRDFKSHILPVKYHSSIWSNRQSQRGNFSEAARLLFTKLKLNFPDYILDLIKISLNNVVC